MQVGLGADDESTLGRFMFNHTSLLFSENHEKSATITSSPTVKPGSWWGRPSVLAWVCPESRKLTDGHVGELEAALLDLNGDLVGLY